MGDWDDRLLCLNGSMMRRYKTRSDWISSANFATTDLLLCRIFTKPYSKCDDDTITNTSMDFNMKNGLRHFYSLGFINKILYYKERKTNEYY